MTPRTRALLLMHFCVVLWGFTAILGKLISLPALPLVFWRTLMVSGTLALLPRCWRAWRAMPVKLLLAYAGVGAVVALHWLTFYASIKLANASVGATCMAFAPVFMAGVEPLVTRRKFDPRELLLGAAVIPGVALVVGGIAPGMRLGVGVGACSALLVSIFGACNKRLVSHADPLAVTGLELGAGMGVLALLSPFLPHTGPALMVPGTRDAVLLAILAGVCTLLPFTLSLVALREMSAFGSQLVVNLEPVYSLLLAYFFLAEHRELSPRFYVGVAIILGAVLAYPLIFRRGEKPAPEVLGAAESKAVSE